MKTSSLLCRFCSNVIHLVELGEIMSQNVANNSHQNLQAPVAPSTHKLKELSSLCIMEIVMAYNLPANNTFMTWLVLFIF